jgi:lipid II:glycine glycyltransferase (peptidoglycan interpeptide bridge formation enzyme)
MSIPEWKVEVDGATPNEWSKMLDLFNDSSIYQTWSYGRVRWGVRNLSHIVVKQNNEVVGMAQLRIIRPTRFKFGIAYLRWGPVFGRRGRTLDPEVLAYMLRALEEEYVGRRGLLLHVLPNAFLRSQRADLFQAAFTRFKSKRLLSSATYRTFVLDLTPPIDELRRRLDKKWRNQLARAEKNNLKVVVGSGGVELAMFAVMYKQMKERKGFKSNMSVDEFAEMQKDLATSHRLRIFICEDGGVPMAGLVASAIGDSAIYLFGATSDSGLRSKGAYLLQWRLIQELKEKGCKWYDLGGIDPAQNPGVYHFKSGLSGTDSIQLSPLVVCNSGLSFSIIELSLTLHCWLRARMDALESGVLTGWWRPEATRS